MQSTPLQIQGGRPINGETNVQHSKNAALPVIIASLLSTKPITLHGIPRLSDVYTILELVRHLGTRHAWTGPNSLTLHTPEITNTDAPYGLVSKMRASFIVLGAIVARADKATVSVPGGCAWGPRPVDQHVKALRSVGVDIHNHEGNYSAHKLHAPRGTFVFDVVTVGGTHNAILASVLGNDTVVLENASIDTDVIDMIQFLNSLGANIEGAGTSTLTIHGVDELQGGEYKVIPDRIEAGTLMIMAAAARGRVLLKNVCVDHMRAVSSKLIEMGVSVTETEDTILVDATNHKLSPITVTTQSYPGFPTDLQPQMVALLTTVEGTSIVNDPVYPERTTHIAELQRMGASIHSSGHTQVVKGGEPLQAAPVRAADLRAGAALIIAATCASGTTVIDGMEYVSRGYEDVLGTLHRLGIDAEQQEIELASAVD